MPLLEVVQTRQVSASIRLTDSTAMQVDQYAAFIHASADDVVEQALAYVFSKDRDFQEFLSHPGSAADYADTAHSSRQCKRCLRAACKQAGFLGIFAGTSTGNRGGIEGMIPRLISVAEPLRCCAPEED